MEVRKFGTARTYTGSELAATPIFLQRDDLRLVLSLTKRIGGSSGLDTTFSHYHLMICQKTENMAPHDIVTTKQIHI